MSMYLLNTDFRVDDLDALRSPGPARRVIEIGRIANIVPLPWLACFKAADLVPCRVTRVDGRTGAKTVSELLSPCTPIESALINLIRSLPFFERLTGDTALAGQYWKAAVARLKQHKLPFVALQATDLLATTPLPALNQTLREGFTWSDAGFLALKRLCLAYTDGLLPLAPDEIDDPAKARQRDRLMNALALDGNIVPPERARAR